MANNNIKSQITLREYLYKRIFVVPSYQRGYIWGQRNGKTDSVTFLLNTLLTGFQNKSDVFLQGVTVYTESTDDKEHDEEVTLIDGQQRTTFFYLLLKELKSEIEKMNNIALYEKMAKEHPENPRLAELVNALKELGE